MGIRNNEAEGAIELIEEGAVCKLIYELEGNQFQILAVNVPSEVGGRGIAAKLVKHALEYAKVEGFKVLPVCSYAKAYMDRHDEYKSLL